MHFSYSPVCFMDGECWIASLPQEKGRMQGVREQQEANWFPVLNQTQNLARSVSPWMFSKQACSPPPHLDVFYHSYIFSHLSD